MFHFLIDHTLRESVALSMRGRDRLDRRELPGLLGAVVEEAGDGVAGGVRDDEPDVCHRDVAELRRLCWGRAGGSLFTLIYATTRASCTRAAPQMRRPRPALKMIVVVPLGL